MPEISEPIEPWHWHLSQNDFWTIVKAINWSESLILVPDLRYCFPSPNGHHFGEIRRHYKCNLAALNLHHVVHSYCPFFFVHWGFCGFLYWSFLSTVFSQPPLPDRDSYQGRCPWWGYARVSCMYVIHSSFGSILYWSLCGLDVEWLIAYIDRTEAQLELSEKSWGEYIICVKTCIPPYLNTCAVCFLCSVLCPLHFGFKIYSNMVVTPM